MSDNKLYESNYFDLNMRMILKEQQVKIYSDKSIYSIEKQVKFDQESKQSSSLEYLLSSLGSSLILSIFEQGKNNKLLIEEIEGKFSLQLSNPLTLLGVNGYVDYPEIKKISGTIYIYADLEEQETLAFCNKSILYSPIYNTLKKTIDLNLKFKILL